MREQWSPSARRIGLLSAVGIAVIGALYLAVIVAWLVIERTPSEPIGDPYLAGMEILTILSGAALLGFGVAVSAFAGPAQRVHAITVLCTSSLAAGLTTAVHFVQLSAVRQMWRKGDLPDYRLVWPSLLFAVEYFVWDILVGLTMLFAARAFAGEAGAAGLRKVLLLGGMLCVFGVAGPLSGRMAFQSVAVVGYCVTLPLAGVLAAKLFKSVSPARVAD